VIAAFLSQATRTVLAMEEITYLHEMPTGEICSTCECEMTVAVTADGGTELACDCTSYLVA
jgi:hypothetical protein